MKKERESSTINFVFSFSLRINKNAFFACHLHVVNIDQHYEVLYCRIFNDILTAMSNDWSEYSSMYAMIDKAILAHRCSKLTVGVYLTAVLLYSTASINFRKYTDEDCRELLIKMELPFEFCESPIYEIVACVQFVQLMAIASAIGMLDALIITLVSYNRQCL